MSRRIAVVGGGWAGISAAVAATDAGYSVTLFEMAPRLGGRARRVDHDDGLALDNGQHILLGAYTETLSLMRRVGADPDVLLRRLTLRLVGPDGSGFRLPGGSPVPAFVRAVLGHAAWSARDRLGLLVAAVRWKLKRFECQEDTSVAELTHGLSDLVRTTLIEPLCIAALNTRADQASARVFLRVLRDALFSGPGSADMLLPRVPLSELLPDPASHWLIQKGAVLRMASRVTALTVRPDGCDVDGERFDAAVLACSANEAARLVQPTAPSWAAEAAAFDYEPIITIYLKSHGSRLPEPMVALASDGQAPAQFAFDLGAIDGGGARDGVFAFVISGARAWVERGLEATAAATLEQARTAFDACIWREPPWLLRTLAERRATFLCTPALVRPRLQIRANLVAAGDYVDGPYPATLEGAVRAGAAAIAALAPLPISGV